ncbi:MAG: spore coat U domain-containing protein [Nevskiales bacterium]
MNRKNSLRALGTALVAGVMLAAGSFEAEAGTAPTSFQVQITLIASCAITATTLNFGSTVGVLTSAVNGSSTLNVTCSNTTPYGVSLDAGTVSGSTVTTRLMAGTTAGNTGTTMQFQLYSDTGRTTQWGNTGGTTVSGIGNGTAQVLTVYGQVPVQTSPKPDTYQTTVTATVTY